MISFITSNGNPGRWLTEFQNKGCRIQVSNEFDCRARGQIRWLRHWTGMMLHKHEDCHLHDTGMVGVDLRLPKGFKDFVDFVFVMAKLRVQR